jgi:hypothetical protein
MQVKIAELFNTRVAARLKVKLADMEYLCRHADSFSASSAEFGGKFRGLRLDDRRTPGLRFSLYHRHVGARADGSVRAILLKREG